MATLLTILIIIASVLMVLIVLIQNPKGGGLSSTFGSATQFGGVRKTTDMLEKATWGLAIIILSISIMTAPFNTTTTVIEEDDAEIYNDPGTGGLDNSAGLPQ
jgi:preprotein translocase subunit SecG